MRGLPVNVAQSVGHTQVRRLVLGDVDRRPSEEELGRCAALVREAIAGWCLWAYQQRSSIHTAVYATTQVIAELAKVAGEYGGRYYTHMRNEGDQLLEAIDEALEIGRIANTPVHIFHLENGRSAELGQDASAFARIQAATGQWAAGGCRRLSLHQQWAGIAALIHPRHSAAGWRD